MNIYVGNLAYQITEEDLKETFGAFGAVDSTAVIKDKYTGRSRGFGFVEMTNSNEAQEAISKLHNADLKGRNLIVNEARPREERRDRVNSGDDRG